MTADTIKLDDDGIPLLETPLTLEQLKTGPITAPLPDLSNDEAITELLRADSSVQALLDALSEDMQKLVAWKVEALLKEQLDLLIANATGEWTSKLVEDIRTQLQLALPGLLANMVEQARRSDPESHG